MMWARAQALRQSVLRHAFTGQLVPQDLNDEAASELLKRIDAERDERARQTTVARQAKDKVQTLRRLAAKN
jgi:type I restriction enzyme S subunit